jgi:hypothetical protein
MACSLTQMCRSHDETNKNTLNHYDRKRSVHLFFVVKLFIQHFCSILHEKWILYKKGLILLSNSYHNKYVQLSISSSTIYMVQYSVRIFDPMLREDVHLMLHVIRHLRKGYIGYEHSQWPDLYSILVHSVPIKCLKLKRCEEIQ